MAKWYAAHNTTPGDPASVQEVPEGDYTQLVTGDYCFLEKEDMLHLFKYNSASSATEDLDTTITPTGNVGNGRWEMKQAFRTGENGFAVRQGPPTDSTISFTDGTRTFSIQPTGVNFKWFVNGVHHNSEGDTVVITDVEGLHWIYYDTDGVLKVQAPGGSTDNLILELCLVGNVYWDATNKKGILVGEERHGNDMASATHYHFHEAIGALYEAGLSLANFDIDGSGANATAAQFDVTDGEFHDEDIEIVIEDGSPQQLIRATIPTFYRDGIGGAWRKLEPATDFPIADGTVGDRLDWNDYNGGTWQLQEVGNLQFVLTHYFATNNIYSPVIGIMGQANYNTANAARTGAEDELASIILAGLPSAEYLAIATVIWQTADGYSNQVAARLISTDTGDDYVDWRQTTVTGAGGTTSDHESLANLYGGAAADHFHLTGVQETALTDGGDTNLHEHDTINYEPDGVAQVLAKNNAVSIPGWVYFGAFGTEGVLNHNVDLNLESYAAGRDVYLKGTKTDTTQHTVLFKGDPDGATELYYAGTKTFETYIHAVNNQGGIKIFGEGGVNTALMYIDDDDTDLTLRNLTNSGWVKLIGTDSTSTLTNLIKADPDGPIELYHDGVKSMNTIADGIVINDADGQYSQIYFSSTTLLIKNFNHSGHVLFKGEDSSGNSDNILEGDPDGAVSLYHAGLKVATTTVNGIELGANGSVYGLLRAYGNGTGSNTGGRILLHTANDFDTTIDYFAIVVTQDDLQIGPVTDLDALEYDGGLGKWIMNGPIGGVELQHAGVRSFVAGGGVCYVYNNTATNYLSIQHSGVDAAIRNFTVAGWVNLQGYQTAGSALVTLVGADPDGAVTLYNAGVGKFSTTTAGVRITDDGDDGLNVQVFSNNNVNLQGIGNGAQLSATSFDDAAAEHFLWVADPDGAMKLYFNGIKTLETYISGDDVGFIVGTNGDKSLRWVLNTVDDWAFLRAYDVPLYLDAASNSAVAQSMHLRSTNAAGTLKSGVVLVDGLQTELYYAGVKAFETNAAGVSVYDTSGNDPAITFYGADLSSNGNIQFLDAGSFTVLNSVNSHTLFYATANGSTKLYHAGNVVLETISSGIKLSAGGSHFKIYDTDSTDPTDFLMIEKNGESANYYLRDASAATWYLHLQSTNAGSTKLFYAGVKTLATQSAGISVYDISGNDPSILFYDDVGALQGTVMMSNTAMLLQVSEEIGVVVRVDSSVDLYYDGGLMMKTSAYGGWVGSGTNVTAATGVAHLQVHGAGYDGYITLDALGMEIGHLSDVRTIDFFIGSGKDMGIVINPLASVQLFYNGIIALETSASGIYIRNADTTSYSHFINNGTDTTIRNYSPHGGRVILSGENLAGVNKNIIIGDPDSSVTLYYAGAAKVHSKDYGLTNIAAVGMGYWFWNTTGNYGTYMSTAADATWGGRVIGETTSVYNMYFRMHGASTYGFVFQTLGPAETFSIHSHGVFSAVQITAPAVGLKEITTPAAVTGYGAIYTKTDNSLYFQDGAGSEHIVGGDVPSGTTMLFYKNTVVAGWTLLTSVDDRLVFISKGSAAGGQTGGGNHSTGTWTISGLAKSAHTHTSVAVAITVAQMPIHSHYSGGATRAYPNPHNFGSTTVNAKLEGTSGPGSYTTGPNTSPTGSGDTHTHGNTGPQSNSTITSSGAWRPLASVFTLQTKV
jgi:hypothetical protein